MKARRAPQARSEVSLLPAGRGKLNSLCACGARRAFMQTSRTLRLRPSAVPGQTDSH